MAVKVLHIEAEAKNVFKYEGLEPIQINPWVFSAIQNITHTLKLDHDSDEQVIIHIEVGSDT